MTTHRMTAIMVGLLYITGTVAGVLSLSLTSPMLQEPDTTAGVIAEIAADDHQLILAALLVLLMGLALAMVPVVIFPILRQRHERLALGYVIVRGALEPLSYLVTVVSWLALVALSRDYTPDGELLGTVLLETENLIAHPTTIIFIVGAVMFYTALYQSRLVPRWLSGWGLLGTVPYVMSAVLSLFGVLEEMSTPQVALFMPLAVQEMVMALWLIVRGFNPAAVVFEVGDQLGTL